MEFVQSPDFWIGLMKIVWINIILSGDNAVVIALAARSLAPHQQKKAVRGKHPCCVGNGRAPGLRRGLMQGHGRHYNAECAVRKAGFVH